MKKILFVTIMGLVITIYATHKQVQVKVQVTDEKIKELKDAYPLSPTSCKQSINRTIALKKFKDKQEEYNTHLVCIMDNKFNYVLSTTKRFNTIPKTLKELFDQNKLNAIHLAYPDYEGNKIEKTIVYKPSNQVGAYLLAKFILSDKLEGIVKYNPRDLNPHTMGTLLGFPEEDIVFFYTIHSFKNNPIYASKLQNPDVTQFAQWSQKDKDLFTRFEKIDWKKSKEYRQLLQDKKNTEQWLTKNKKYKFVDLKKQVENLQEKIKPYLKKEVFLKKMAEQEGWV